MKIILKFRIEDTTKIEIPASAKIIHVAIQSGLPHMWALIDPKEENVTRKFHIYGTGHPVHDNMIFVGTWLDTPYVWHLFEEERYEG